MSALADRCPACGGALARWRSVPSSEPALAGGRYELARCGRCGTGVTLGPAPGGSLYSSGAYGPRGPRLRRPAAPLMRGFARRRLALLEPFIESGARLLDVGAGQGRFVAAARRAGYDAWGIDPFARRMMGAAVPVQRVSVERARLPDASLDAVSLWHVLEHLERPASALARIGGWLRPGGALLVGVPNLASLQAWVGGEDWYHLDPPRHRTHFTAAGVVALLARSGFSVVSLHHLVAEHNPFGFWQSLVNRVTDHPSYLYNLLKRNAPVRSPDLALTLAAVPLAPLAALAELLAGIAGAGGTVAVVGLRGGRRESADR